MLNELISCCVIGINTFISSIFGHIPFLHSPFYGILNVDGVEQGPIVCHMLRYRFGICNGDLQKTVI